jgi:alkanesulfonate monooxygenase SsuD/methylene tetrahydromethanopterin reductase-like flavin-dependent oxidoreductase (luciferase family)
VLYAAVAMRTERICIRPMSTVLLTWNHPIQIAERFGALDILSKGRAELCLARSNSMDTMKVFGVNPALTREIFAESLDILKKIFVNPQIEHEGKHWKITPATVTPTCVDGRFPKLSIAATSVTSHESAGRSSYGVITFDNYFGFDYLDECVTSYRDGWSGRDSDPAYANDYFGLYVATAYCAPTLAEAAAVADHQAQVYFDEVLRVMNLLADKPGYEYMAKLNEFKGIRDTPDWLRKNTPSVMIGTPEDYVERLKALERRGVDEVLLRIDGFGHEQIMRSIELIGREVIPAVS